MSPARIVAVTALALEVHADLAAGPPLDHGSASGALFKLLERDRLQLQAIHAAAVREMNALVPAFLAREDGAAKGAGSQGTPITTAAHAALVQELNLLGLSPETYDQMENLSAAGPEADPAGEYPAPG